jgi:signal recognition particle receptor subunit alpha
MIDLFCIFTTGGLILWYKSFVSKEFTDLINLLIKNILLDEKRTQEFYLHAGNVMRWKVINNAGLIFVVSYQESYNVLYVDILLDLIVKDFTENHLNNLKKNGKVYLEGPNYNEAFLQHLKKWERYCQDKLE